MSSAGYTIKGGHLNVNPADAATYFWGSFVALAPSQGNAAIRKMYILEPGVITALTLYVVVGGTGTAELSTFSLRVNNITDYVITSALSCAVAETVVQQTGLNIPVVAGDYLEVKWLCPTWVTNPTVVLGDVVIYVAQNAVTTGFPSIARSVQ